MSSPPPPQATRPGAPPCRSPPPCVFLLTVPVADWPQHLGPARDGVSAETGLNWAWPPAGPPVAWQVPVGSGWAGPVVEGGRVVVFHRVGPNEVVQALDPATGRERWTFDYPSRYRDDFQFDDGPRATPLVAGGRVYTLGANGDLHALDAATGKKVWHRNILADYKADKGYFGVACSPPAGRRPAAGERRRQGGRDCGVRPGHRGRGVRGRPTTRPATRRPRWEWSAAGSGRCS